MQTFTWDDLAEAISKLPQEERKRPALIQLEDNEFVHEVDSLEQSDEDVYVHESDPSDFGTLKDLKEHHGDTFKRKDYNLSHPKGTAFLYVS